MHCSLKLCSHYTLIMLMISEVIVKVHLAPKYNCSLAKSLLLVKLIGEIIFQFGRMIDASRPVEVEKHLVQVGAKRSWAESSCDVKRRAVFWASRFNAKLKLYTFYTQDLPYILRVFLAGALLLTPLLERAFVL